MSEVVNNTELIISNQASLAKHLAAGHEILQYREGDRYAVIRCSSGHTFLYEIPTLIRCTIQCPECRTRFTNLSEQTIISRDRRREVF